MSMESIAGVQRTFKQVQFLLDHNRLLIKEINVNQESQIPESLTRNVALIKELNGNIKQVVDLYAGLSSSFVRNQEGSGNSLPAVVLPDHGQKRPRSS